MLRAGFTKIAMWQTSKKQRWRKQPEYQEEKTNVKCREHYYWMGTEIGMLGGYGLQGQITAGDGTDKQGKMGAGCNNLRRKKKKQQCKVGREGEGSSSNRPELAAFLWRFVTR